MKIPELKVELKKKDWKESGVVKEIIDNLGHEAEAIDSVEKKNDEDEEVASKWLCSQLKFKDMEESLETFSVDDNRSIKKRVEEFKELAEIAGFT